MMAFLIAASLINFWLIENHSYRIKRGMAFHQQLPSTYKRLCLNIDKSIFMLNEQTRRHAHRWHRIRNLRVFHPTARQYSNRCSRFPTCKAPIPTLFHQDKSVRHCRITIYSLNHLNLKASLKLTLLFLFRDQSSGLHIEILNTEQELINYIHSEVTVGA